MGKKLFLIFDVLLSEHNELKQFKSENPKALDTRAEYFETLRWQLTRPGAAKKREQKADEKRFENSLTRLTKKWNHS